MRTYSVLRVLGNNGKSSCDHDLFHGNNENGGNLKRLTSRKHAPLLYIAPVYPLPLEALNNAIIFSATMIDEFIYSLVQNKKEKHQFSINISKVQ